MDENKCTPLWYACKYGHAESVIALINTGAAAFPVDYDSSKNYEDSILDDDVMELNSDDEDERFNTRNLCMGRLAEMPTYPLHEAARSGNYGTGWGLFLSRKDRAP